MFPCRRWSQTRCLKGRTINASLNCTSATCDESKGDEDDKNVLSKRCEEETSGSDGSAKDDRPTNANAVGQQTAQRGWNKKAISKTLI
jgi:hypothetical protein